MQKFWHHETDVGRLITSNDRSSDRAPWRIIEESGRPCNRLRSLLAGTAKTLGEIRGFSLFRADSVSISRAPIALPPLFAPLQLEDFQVVEVRPLQLVVGIGERWSGWNRRAGPLSVSDINSWRGLTHITSRQEMKMRAESEVEAEIKAKGLNAPRLSPKDIDDLIVAEHWGRASDLFAGAPMAQGTQCLTICVLTLKNGYVVVGESACASPENFDPDLEYKIARDNARNKIWALEGYALRSRT